MPLEHTQPRSIERARPTTTVEKENRRIQRISLPLPVRVEVRISKDVSWYEITRLNDVSAFGCGFMIKRPIKRWMLTFKPYRRSRRRAESTG